MRCFALLATLYAATLGTTSALVDARVRTTVGVAANGYDDNTVFELGCSPDGCIPENTRDQDISINSRWSCKGNILDNDDGCWIEYYFDEPQDIVKIKIFFYKGDERVRTVCVFENGTFHSQIESSGTTDGYETFYLHTDETAELMLILADYESNPDVWLSMQEVQIMVR